MNSKEMIKKVAEKSDFTQKDIELVLKYYAEYVNENIMTINNIPLPGLGKFETKKRNARQARNPKTGENVNVSACKVPYFKISPTFVKNQKEEI